jgi:hypothetical protein
MYSVASRIKTNGSYTKCAVMDKEFKAYANKVEDNTFNTINEAIKFITMNGDKSKIYYIYSEYQASYDVNNKNNDKFDAGNNWFVRQRYTYTNKNWTRICLTTSAPYDLVHKLHMLTKL